MIAGRDRSGARLICIAQRDQTNFEGVRRARMTVRAAPKLRLYTTRETRMSPRRLMEMHGGRHLPRHPFEGRRLLQGCRSLSARKPAVRTGMLALLSWPLRDR